MKIYQGLEQGTEEWLRVRLGKFTASDAQAIAANGKGLETLIYDKAAEIMTKRLPNQYSNVDLERGKELEHLARNSYEMETGNTVGEVGFIESDEYSGCSPDGLVGDDGLVEFKCPNDRVYLIYLYTGKVDTGYEWQMQMQMLVSGREWVDYVAYNPNFERCYVIKRINRDEVKISKLKVGIAQATAQLQTILGALI